MSSGTILVTGACGLVGSEVVAELIRRGRHVVASDLDSPANRKAASKHPQAEARWADPARRDEVENLLKSVAPQAIVHLHRRVRPSQPTPAARPALLADSPQSGRRVRRAEGRSREDRAGAFANACDTEESTAIYLVGGDDSHRRRQADITRATFAAIGLRGSPAGRPGDPDNDSSWFATDWMDTADSQRVLDFGEPFLRRPDGRHPARSRLEASPGGSGLAVGTGGTAPPISLPRFPRSVRRPVGRRCQQVALRASRRSGE